MKQLAQESAKKKSHNFMGCNLFQRLAMSINELDEHCPITREINDLKKQIIRKRARIHVFQQEGQKPLWGKDGSYEPAHVYSRQHDNHNVDQIEPKNKHSHA